VDGRRQRADDGDGDVGSGVGLTAGAAGLARSGVEASQGQPGTRPAALGVRFAQSVKTRWDGFQTWAQAGLRRQQGAPDRGSGPAESHIRPQGNSSLPGPRKCGSIITWCRNCAHCWRRAMAPQLVFVRGMCAAAGRAVRACDGPEEVMKI
jgi:hypothetical protein